MIKVSGVRKRFDGVTALDGLDINIEKGSIYGLVGTNGAGKTTIIKQIMGIQRPDEGEITIDGQPVYENTEVKARLGYVSDELYFFPGNGMRETAKFLAGLYPGWDMDRFEKMVADFGLDPKKKITSFSKGMQKQAALIFALSAMPDCLILDEPIDGLDPVVRLKAWKYIIDDVAERQTTVLVSSHNLREMEGYCDHIGIISKGRMVIERDLEDLKSDVHKVQIAFKGGPVEAGASEEAGAAADIYGDLNVLHKETRGSVTLLIVRESREKIEEVLRAKDPAILDILPLSLEEIFIYELGGESDEISSII